MVLIHCIGVPAIRNSIEPARVPQMTEVRGLTVPLWPWGKERVVVKERVVMRVVVKSGDEGGDEGGGEG